MAPMPSPAAPTGGGSSRFVHGRGMPSRLSMWSSWEPTWVSSALQAVWVSVARSARRWCTPRPGRGRRHGRGCWRGDRDLADQLVVGVHAQVSLAAVEEPVARLVTVPRVCVHRGNESVGLDSAHNAEHPHQRRGMKRPRVRSQPRLGPDLACQVLAGGGGWCRWECRAVEIRVTSAGVTGGWSGLPSRRKTRGPWK